MSLEGIFLLVLLHPFANSAKKITSADPSDLLSSDMAAQLSS